MVTTTVPDKNRSGPSYEALVSRMRERPTFPVAEEIIKKDYPLKLPDRRYLQLWNTPEISQFRGYESLVAAEEHRDQHEKERIEIREAAREAANGLGPDLGIVHDMMAHHRLIIGSSRRLCGSTPRASRRSTAGRWRA